MSPDKGNDSVNRLMKISLSALAAAGLAVGAMTVANAAGPGNAPGAQPPPKGDAQAVPHVAVAAAQGTIYVPITPCRIVDTRVGTGTNGTPIGNGQLRTYYVGGTTGFAPQGGKSTGCGIPIGASAIAATLSAVSPSHPGYLRAWPNGQSEPSATLVQYSTTNAAGATVPINATSAYALRVHNFGGPTELVIDVAGYYTKQIYGTFASDGTLTNGNGTLVAYTHTTTGYYTLHANRDLTGCTPVASAYYYAYNVAAYAFGEYVYVELTDNTGTPSNYYFQVQIDC
jgi:hypothetical protein